MTLPKPANASSGLTYTHSEPDAFYFIDRAKDLATEIVELRHGFTQSQKEEIKKTAWENLPQLGGMIAATAGGILLRRTAWGMAAQFLAPLVFGTATGTLAQVGLKYIQYQWDKEHGKNPEEIDWGNLWLQSANDAFGASMSISIGGGVTAGLGALSSRYGANLLVRMAASNIGRGIIVNETIGVAHALKNWDATYGIEDVVISAGTGALGGAWAPLLQNRWKSELFCEVNREFGENILQKKFDRCSDGDLTIQNVTESFVLSFAELGGSIKGHRGGLDPDHEPPTANHQFRASLPFIAGLVALGIDISTYATNSDDQSTNNQRPPVSSAAALLFGIRKRNKKGDPLPPQGKNEAPQLPEVAKRMGIPKRGRCLQEAHALLELLADNNINGQLILLTQAGGIRMRNTVWGDDRIRYDHHYVVLVNNGVIDRTLGGELQVIPFSEYVQNHFEQPDQVRMYPDCVIVEDGELYRHHPLVSFYTLDVEEGHDSTPYLTDLSFLLAPEIPPTSHVITLEDNGRLDAAKRGSDVTFDDDTSRVESREVDLDYYRERLREAQDREDHIAEQLWTQYLNRYQTQVLPSSPAVAGPAVERAHDGQDATGVGLATKIVEAAPVIVLGTKEILAKINRYRELASLGIAQLIRKSLLPEHRSLAEELADIFTTGGESYFLRVDGDCAFFENLPSHVLNNMPPTLTLSGEQTQLRRIYSSSQAAHSNRFYIRLDDLVAHNHQVASEKVETAYEHLSADTNVTISGYTLDDGRVVVVNGAEYLVAAHHRGDSHLLVSVQRRQVDNSPPHDVTEIEIVEPEHTTTTRAQSYEALRKRVGEEEMIRRIRESSVNPELLNRLTQLFNRSQQPVTAQKIMFLETMLAHGLKPRGKILDPSEALVAIVGFGEETGTIRAFLDSGYRVVAIEDFQGVGTYVASDVTINNIKGQFTGHPHEDNLRVIDFRDSTFPTGQANMVLMAAVQDEAFATLATLPQPYGVIAVTEMGQLGSGRINYVVDSPRSFITQCTSQLSLAFGLVLHEMGLMGALPGNFMNIRGEQAYLVRRNP